MSRLFRLLTILSLVWCALGVGEPAAAHDDTSAQHITIGAPHAGDTPVDLPPAPESGGHHHCPVAPDLPLVAAAPAIAPVAAMPVAGRSTALASLTRAPPLQPPAA